MSAIKQRSAEASSIHFDAMREMDAEGRSDPDSYRAMVGVAVHQAMMRELEPTTSALVNMSALSLAPPPAPPAVQELRDFIVAKWTRVFEELTGAR